MPKTKKEAAEILKLSADRLLIPLDFEEQENGDLFSSKFVVIDGIDEESDVIHSVVIDDESMQSMCSIRLEKELDGAELEKLCAALEEKTNCPFFFDASMGQLSAGVDIPAEALENMPQDDTEADKYLAPFFIEPMYLMRYLYTAYAAVTENGRTVEEALPEAEAAAEEHYLDYHYKYNMIRDIVEDRGNRYFFEHSHFPLVFYTCTDDLISQLLSQTDEETVGTLEALLYDYDVPPIAGYDKIHVEKWEDSPERKCVHLILPKCVNEYDCSDIVLVSSEKETYYYTVEAGVSRPGSAKRDYFLCGWDEEECHSNFGCFNCRDRALAALRKKLKENE